MPSADVLSTLSLSNAPESSVLRLEGLAFQFVAVGTCPAINVYT